MPELSVFATFDGMDGLEADTRLINALADWAKIKPSPMAEKIGVAVTTLTRPANGKATTRISRATIDKLKAEFPDFPGWAPEQESNGKPFQLDGPNHRPLAQDLPIYGTCLGAERKVDGDAVEQTTLNTGEVVEYAKRPPILQGNRAAYGLFVSGSSMEPRYYDGETILVDPKARLRAGDFVVVYLRPLNPDDDDGEAARAVLVKRLVRRSASEVELHQFTPERSFSIPMSEVVRIDRVIPWSELL